MERIVSVILLAGGQGKRMQSTTPKQFVDLGGRPIARHSFDLFQSRPEVAEIIVICAPEYRHHFHNHTTFALPGERRQDSVYNGLQLATSDIICVHDAARPLVTPDAVERVLQAAYEHGAAALGMPIKFTVKESCTHHFVTRTPDRAHLWEIQTPQAIHRHLLEKGFEYAHEHNITVTDDVSLVELINHEVKLVKGSYSNLKITTPEDLKFAAQLLQ